MDKLIQEIYELVDLLESEADKKSLKKEIEEITKELEKAKKAGDKEKVKKLEKKLKELKDKLAGYGYASEQSDADDTTAGDQPADSDEKSEPEPEKAEKENEQQSDADDEPEQSIAKKLMKIDDVVKLLGALFDVPDDVMAMIREKLQEGDLVAVVDLLKGTKPTVYEPLVYEKEPKTEAQDQTTESKEESSEMDEKVTKILAEYEQIKKERDELLQRLEAVEKELEERRRNEIATARMRELEEAGIKFDDEETKAKMFELLKSLDDEGYEFQKKLLLAVKESASKALAAKASAPVTESEIEKSSTEKLADLINILVGGEVEDADEES